MRRFSGWVVFIGLMSFGLKRQFQGEDGAFAHASALANQRTAQFPGGEGSAVQAKTMPVLSGGKTMIENPGLILRRNSDAVIDDRNLHAAISVRDADDHLFVRTARF